MKDEKNSTRKQWEELFMGAIEKIALAPSKLKDPKESVAAAVDWVKSLKDDVQSRVVADVSERLAQLDWEEMGKNVSEHLAKNFDIEVVSKISLKPKKKNRAGRLSPG